ncbi:hypothetical protein SKAU_G00095110 [Synaphobranchus kaupii]|uniref:Uncharacterized protein n=1 Tax=Synaphobranchus kaupii TaxID=118154 RepID=A0A9Q1J6W6_SYNKA|nr:hypothetical protein SKAU_G00095110 [Synaphobranchus kaupii]
MCDEEPGRKEERTGENQDNKAGQDEERNGGEEIPLLSKQPIRSLGRSYTAELSDKQVGEAVRKQLADGLARIHRSQLPGKYKVWCYQHVLYHRVM